MRLLITIDYGLYKEASQFDEIKEVKVALQKEGRLFLHSMNKILVSPKIYVISSPLCFKSLHM
jgi:hypothetical protein